MMAVKLLVKIAVMMMAPGGTPVAPEAREREPPSFLFFLELLPSWEKGLPSGPCSPWHGRGESPSEIGSVSLSLSVSALPSAALSPFRIYMEICNSDWTEVFAVIFSLQKLAFLRQNKSSNRLTGCPRGSGARPPASWPPRAPSRLDFSSGILQIFQKYFPSVFIPFGFRLIWIFCETKTCNKQELALGTGSMC